MKDNQLLKLLINRKIEACFVTHYDGDPGKWQWKIDNIDVMEITGIPNNDFDNRIRRISTITQVEDCQEISRKNRITKAFESNPDYRRGGGISYKIMASEYDRLIGNQPDYKLIALVK